MYRIGINYTTVPTKLMVNAHSLIIAKDGIIWSAAADFLPVFEKIVSDVKRCLPTKLF